jgi:hypothetical protein
VKEIEGWTARLLPSRQVCLYIHHSNFFQQRYA